MVFRDLEFYEMNFLKRFGTNLLPGRLDGAPAKINTQSKETKYRYLGEKIGVMQNTIKKIKEANIKSFLKEKTLILRSVKKTRNVTAQCPSMNKSLYISVGLNIFSILKPMPKK